MIFFFLSSSVEVFSLKKEKYQRCRGINALFILHSISFPFFELPTQIQTNLVGRSSLADEHDSIQLPHKASSTSILSMRKMSVLSIMFSAISPEPRTVSGILNTLLRDESILLCVCVRRKSGLASVSLSQYNASITICIWKWLAEFYINTVNFTYNINILYVLEGYVGILIFNKQRSAGTFRTQILGKCLP